MVTSDCRPKVKIWLFHACTTKNMQLPKFLRTRGNRGWRTQWWCKI